MLSFLRLKNTILIILLFTGVLRVRPALAEPILSDGTTQTVVTPNGNRLDISGNTFSQDGANLFHSFQTFNLNSGEIANFLSNPSIQNILGRVTGGNASMINGVIQVTGGNSNLYLMNPAGIIFGSNATLNVPASFTATTATGIGFGNGWFNAAGGKDFVALVGTPNTFVFNTTSQPGAIVNAGQLVVTNGQNLTLLGGTVINTGLLAAPQGNITVAAVPDQNLVRISKPGNLLSLEIEPEAPGSQLGSWTIPVLSLPQLLTGGGGSPGTGLTLNTQGQVVLTGSGVEIPTEAGVTIASGTLDASTPNNQGGVGGNVNVLGDKVGLLSANINASGTDGGGNVRIGGDVQGKGTVPNASHTFVSNDTSINANALSIGNGGDVIVWSDQTTDFFGNISVRGGLNSGNGGFAEVSGKQSLNFQGLVDSRAPAGNVGTLLLDPTDITISNGTNTPSMTFSGGIFSDNTTPSSTLSTTTLQNQLAFGDVIVSTASGLGGAGNIFVNSPITWNSGSSLTLLADNNININSGANITYSGGASLFLTANNNITISSDANITYSGATNGELNLQANNNILFNSNVLVNATTGTGKLDVTLNADRDGNSTGAITLNPGSSIISNNGDITIGGGSNPSITPVPQGVNLNSATLNSGTGNIEIAGSSSGTDGIQITGGSVLQSAGGGNIKITGIGSGGGILLNGGSINSTGTGKIDLSSSGSIDTTTGSLSGSNISFQADKNITTNALTGTNINLSADGKITTGALTLLPISSSGGSESLTINTSEALTLNNPIVTNGRNIFIGNVTAPSQISVNTTLSTSGGDVNINSLGAIALLSEVITTGGDIKVSGTTINTASLDSSNTNGNGGLIQLIANGNITTTNLSSSSSNGNGGDISLTSNAGYVTSGNLNASGATGGGKITLQAGDYLTTANINSSSSNGNGGGISLTSNGAVTSGDLKASGVTGGGVINVESGTSITTGKIDSSSSNGNGGDVKLDPPGDIQVTSINAQGGTNGTGGKVDITTDSFFRASGTFTEGSCINTSICTTGGAGSNSIRIKHGGNGITPFDVGDSSRNGTAGAITSGNSTIPSLQSFLYDYNLGNIGIISVPEPLSSPSPSLPPPSSPSPSLQISQPPLPYSSPSLTTEPPPPLPADLNDAVATVDKLFTDEFTQFLGLNPVKSITFADAQNILRRINRATRRQPAIIYAVFVPSTGTSKTTGNNRASLDVNPQLSELVKERQDSDELELILVTSDGTPKRIRVPGTTRSSVLEVAGQLRREVTDITSRPPDYLPPAQKMYQWLIAPLEEDLKALGIENLVFIMDAGLRSVPLAALHDGQKFLVQKYSVGLMPSLSLTNTRYANLKDAQVLAMGASKFSNQTPLPAVPVELSQITSIWKGKSFLNQDFTLTNLKAQRRQKSFGIVHLATHAFFQPGKPGNSYIQLSDTKLGLDELQQLDWNQPSVELLVLSGCKTAQGDEEVELGFAGLAVQSGVKSALASLWFISDEGTMALMAEFYEQLQQVPIKAEALQRAQIAMLKGKVRLEDGKLVTPTRTQPLPPELRQLGNQSLSHPKFWAAFTVIGNPW